MISMQFLLLVMCSYAMGYVPRFNVECVIQTKYVQPLAWARPRYVAPVFSPKRFRLTMSSGLHAETFDSCLEEATKFGADPPKAMSLAVKLFEIKSKYAHAVDLLASKDREMAAKNGELAAKDGELAAKQALLTATEMQLLQVQARTQAMSASRIVLETALHSYGKSLAKQLSTTALLNDFRTKVLLDASGSLRPSYQQLTATLAGFGIDAKMDDVKAHLAILYKTLSFSFHYNVRPLPSIDPGIYIGGEEPMATALALTMLALQTAGHTDFELHVLGGDGKPKCKLVGGNVLAVSTAFRFVFVLSLRGSASLVISALDLLPLMF